MFSLVLVGVCYFWLYVIDIFGTFACFDSQEDAFKQFFGSEMVIFVHVLATRRIFLCMYLFPSGQMEYFSSQIRHFCACSGS